MNYFPFEDASSAFVVVLLPHRFLLSKHPLLERRSIRSCLFCVLLALLCFVFLIDAFVENNDIFFRSKLPI